MEDTQTQQAVPTATEDSSQPTSPVSEAPAETVAPTSTEEPAAPVAAEPAPSEPAPAESQPSRLDRRIDQLKTKGQSMQELAENLSQLRESPSPNPLQEVSPSAPKVSDLLPENPTYDDLDKVGQQVFEQGAQSAKGMTSLEIQQLRSEIVAKEALRDAASTTDTLPVLYSELDPNSKIYNPALEKKIVSEYETLAIQKKPNGQVIVNPSVKLNDVARREVDFFREAMEAGKAQTSVTLAQQQSEGALTPSVSSPEPDKEFGDLSLAEMESRLRAKGHDI